LITNINEYLILYENLNENLIAYHGTNINFDKFSDLYIGSGIGNAGFGYGIYLTASKKEARNWAKTLEKPANAIIDNVEQSNEICKFLTNALNLHGNNPQLLLHILKTNLNNLYKDNKISKNEYEFIQNSNILKIKRNRYIYEVYIKGDNFIYWNKPITIDQINNIKNLNYLENINIKIIDDNIIIINNKNIKNGEDLYTSFKMSAKNTSYFLNKCGIDGIIYYDNGENYVIFNPNIIEIKKKINF
jgi:hypothetical protein